MINPLHDDARSAWAYRRYLAGREPGPIHPAVGAGILAQLLPGDHVELIADTVSQRTLEPLTGVSRRDRPLDLAVRTLRAWFLVDRNTGGIAVLPGAPTSLGYTSGADAPWEVTGWTNAHYAVDGRHFYFKVFLDSLDAPEVEVLAGGAGGQIMRLPENPAVPSPPAPDLPPDEVATYVQEVRQRVTDAFTSTGVDRARSRELYPGQHTRLRGYLTRAVENLTDPEAAASARSAVIFHHHTELLAAVYFRELGLPYPPDAPPTGTQKPETLDDYYR
ncbi:MULTISPECIES: hypothetical protein [Actinoplanes]|uniref:Uncharacterized protein n=2 Tax=Actinoplanes TaxID=1865 RepID=A0A101JHS0_9ACTN|nr:MULTISPECIES: hypothetical protein [Actinoplanes]KUL27019.1 hypothetical protein ADL15_36510 [Actinoplanes awajinensis subsp. mycoplanecinus]GIE72564.1 hypothetical protein Apa02nite_086720 [Actinoplanes palleronii]